MSGEGFPQSPRLAPANDRDKPEERDKDYQDGGKNPKDKRKPKIRKDKKK